MLCVRARLLYAFQYIEQRYCNKSGWGWVVVMYLPLLCQYCMRYARYGT